MSLKEVRDRALADAIMVAASMLNELNKESGFITGKNNEESLFACEPHNPVHELCLCEHDKIIPKPNQLYRFTVDENCEKCRDLATAYGEEE